MDQRALDVYASTHYPPMKSEAYAVPVLISGTHQVHSCVSVIFLDASLTSIQEIVMAKGKVKWWDNKKGLGFIAQEAGQDVFVHHTAILGEGFKTLREGDEVIFEIVTGEKGPKAEKVQRAHGA